MRLDLAGMAVLVTGAARGIGEAIATACSEAGASVGLMDLDQAAVEAAASSRQEAGGAAIAIPGDVSRPGDAFGAIDQMIAAFGSIDGLVNNAAIIVEASTVDTTQEQWDRTLGVNLTGAWLLSKAAIPHMVQQGSGSIVNVASIEAHSVRGGHAAYVAAKAGLVGLTKVMAVEYGPEGIRANSVSPGSIATSMFREYVAQHPDPEAFEAELVAMNRRGRLGTPEEVAALVVYLLADVSGFVNGADFVIDGGRLIAT